jgi:hypothetical protein
MLIHGAGVAFFLTPFCLPPGIFYRLKSVQQSEKAVALFLFGCMHGLVSTSRVATRSNPVGAISF